MSAAGTHQQGGAAGAGEAYSNPRRGTHIGRACDTCRRRHVKCDGAEPQCVQCVITHNQCERTGTDHRRGQHAADIAQLQARITELEIKLDAKTTELETKTTDFGERAAALETSNRQLVGEVATLKLAIGMQQVSLTVSDDSDASTPFTPFSSSVPSSQGGSSDPNLFLRPITSHGNDHLPVPYDRGRRRHRRALSERSVSRSGIPSTSSSAVPSPHIPALVIDPEPPGGWNATVASFASAGALPAFPHNAAMGSPNYTQVHPVSAGTPTVPVGNGNAADDHAGILFASWVGGVPEVTLGSGPMLDNLDVLLSMVMDDQAMDG